MAENDSSANLVVVKGGVVIADTLGIAERFGKRHSNVLQAVENLECSVEFRELNFKPSNYMSRQGKLMPCYEATRDGFSFLVMGFTGKEAAEWKEKYIAAFNLLEDQVRKNIGHTESVMESCLRVLTENQYALQNMMANGFGSVNGRIDAVSNKVDHLHVELTGIAAEVQQIANRGLKKIKDSVKSDIVRSVRILGGNCPCCGVNKIVSQESELIGSPEFDHFYQNSQADADHVWLICKPCHAELTYGRVQRGERQDEFNAFQKQRRRLPGMQPMLLAIL
jgi:Rha family phage regulatory protein